MLARPVARHAAIGINAQHLGVIHRQPAGWGGGGGAEYGFDAVLCQPDDGPVEQVKVEMPLKRFPQMPGKFAHPDCVGASGGKSFGIAIPIVFIHMFGVMRGAQQEFVMVQSAPDGQRGGGFSGHESTLTRLCNGCVNWARAPAACGFSFKLPLVREWS